MKDKVQRLIQTVDELEYDYGVTFSHEQFECAGGSQAATCLACIFDMQIEELRETVK